MEGNKAYLDANEFEVYDDIDEIETKILGSTVFADLLSDAGSKPSSPVVTTKICSLI